MAIGVSVKQCFIRTWVEAVSGAWGEFLEDVDESEA